MEVAEATDERLAELSEQLERNRWACELLDAEWRLVWASNEMGTIFGEDDAAALGIGCHALEARRRTHGLATEESRKRWVRTNVPYMLDAVSGDGAELADLVDPSLAPAFEGLEPRPAPPLWTSHFDFSREHFSGRVNYSAQRIHTDDGELLGYLYVYGPDQPASVVTLLVRGDRSMYARMAELIEPATRPAAILLADLESSTEMSRRLSSAAYFRLIRSVRSSLEAAVGEQGGILGKHAGDGVVAFFISAQLGSVSAAARAAVETARSLPGLTEQAVRELAEDDVPLDPEDWRLNAAVHWGATLYIGQVASQGRLEVTALGDEMNEAARMEQTARDGQLLASKQLLERLDPGDAAALGLDPGRLGYRPLGELEGATEKAAREAGTIAVTDIRSRGSSS